MMKRIGIWMTAIVVFINLNACDLSDDDGVNFFFEPLQVTAAEFPESFELGEVYRIQVDYLRPTDCHFFEGFDFSVNAQTERTIIAVGLVENREDCEVLSNEELTQFFDFEVRFTGTYTFRFFTGKNSNGENEYLVYEVPVISN
ncbi:hypothetical protein [Robertkochia aurantiaca]|uniref:hypothetical protein n=1 Tax=Robertkochia aurantiaca TaxID=2873700 RepID=UPI001CCB8237|nr:hypothetical protein [Robertkochia sp. 3YJGBD-33]